MKPIDVKIPFLFEYDDSFSSEKDELAHWHNSFEIIEILDGTYTCHVSGSSFSAGKGDICIINRGKIHRVLNSEDEASFCKKKTLIFDPEYFIKNEDIYHKYVEPLEDEQAFSHMQFSRTTGIGSELFRLIDEIEELNDAKPEGYEIDVIAHIYMLIRRLYLSYQSHNALLKEHYDPNQKIQQRMLSYIYEHYADKLSLEDIADAGQVSKSTCIRIFREYIGKSPIDFLNSYRLEISSRLLAETTARITDISFRCGFSQPSYFNRMFMKEFGMTPNRYRKLHRA